MSETIDLRFPELDTKSFDSLEKKQLLNDTIVEFYLIYLIKKTWKSKRDQFHLFNTYFYDKIKNLSKGDDHPMEDISRKWYRNVRIFDKDFLVMPICNCNHWLLVIICYPGDVIALNEPRFLNGDDKTSHRPCMIIFDSLRSRYMSKFLRPIRKFLHSRWLYERPNEHQRSFNDSFRFPHYHAKVPNQRNPYDCGIYMLHFFEEFLESPRSSVMKVVMEQELLDWKLDPNQKRDEIKSIIIRSGESLTITD